MTGEDLSNSRMRVDVVDGLRQPEYTGENRCEPCTVLNLFVAAVFGALVARRSRLGGLLALAVSVGAIYLRGYLVPGTPTLTKQYLPPSVLRWFGKDPEPELATGLGGGTVDSAADGSTPSTAEEGSTGSGGATEADEPGDERPTGPDDLETYLSAHGILEPCADTDDLCLTDAFETAWLEAAEPLADAEVDTSEVVDAFGVDDDVRRFDLLTRGEARLLMANSKRIGQWPSRAALVADIGASRVLRSWVPDWDAYDPQQKGRLLNGLRLFLETCPTTGGATRIGEEAVESCCSSHKVVAVTCEETGERLLEQRLVDDET